MCEFDEAAKIGLSARFPDVELWTDVLSLRRIPAADIVTAGFPCQDLSLAGRAHGISGARSGLVWQIFRLIDAAKEPPRWLVLENVPFLLQLQKGGGMRLLVEELEQRGFEWALPSHRHQGLRTASAPAPRHHRCLHVGGSPRSAQVPTPTDPPSSRRIRKPRAAFIGPKAIGESVGPKDGSHRSRSARPSGFRLHRPFGFRQRAESEIPDVRDLERLQGFESDWTKPAEAAARRNDRWRLVGNAVSVPVSRWLGERLSSPKPYNAGQDWPMPNGGPWPNAGWGGAGRAVRIARLDVADIRPAPALDRVP